MIAPFRTDSELLASFLRYVAENPHDTGYRIRECRGPAAGCQKPESEITRAIRNGDCARCVVTRISRVGYC